MKVNTSSHPQLIGVFVSFLVIWQIHKFFVVNDCTAQQGSFEYKTGLCLLPDGTQFQTSLPDIVLGSYFIIGLVVSFIVAKLVRKYISK